MSKKLVLKLTAVAEKFDIKSQTGPQDIFLVDQANIVKYHGLAAICDWRFEDKQ